MLIINELQRMGGQIFSKLVEFGHRIRNLGYEVGRRVNVSVCQGNSASVFPHINEVKLGVDWSERCHRSDRVEGTILRSASVVDFHFELPLASKPISNGDGRVRPRYHIH